MNEIHLKPGAIALIDLLGVKGIWRQKGATKYYSEILHEVDLKRQNDLMEKAEFSIKDVPEMDKIELREATFSDTILIGAFHKDRNKKNLSKSEKIAAVLKLSARISKLQQMFLISSKKLSLTFRGVVTLGEIFWEDDRFFGPAIDEAASLYELPTSATAYFSPSAHELFLGDNPAKNHILSTHTGITYGENGLAHHEADVHLKGGVVIRTSIVNPFWDTDDYTKDQLWKAIIESFRRNDAINNVGIFHKYQHTLKLLQLFGLHIPK